MNRLIALLLCIATTTAINANTNALPKPNDVLAAMHLANDYFMNKHKDPTLPTFVKKERPSNLWTRGVYYEGLCELIAIDSKKECIDYINKWANFHEFKPRNGSTTRDADDYCCCQAYIFLYERKFSQTGERDMSMLKPTINCMNNLLNPVKPKDELAGKVRWSDNSVEDWTWIDAIQMGLPVLTRLSRVLAIDGDSDAGRYAEQGWKMYEWTRNTLAGGLFNPLEGLWWRDKDFTPPYKAPNGMNCYWSRGNGWVYAALVRAMDNALIAKHAGPPANLEPKGEYKWNVMDFETHYEQYEKDFCQMSYALARCQRKDGTWNVDMLDPNDYGGMELTGTALFVYGMAWGVRHGVLPKKMFKPIIAKAWKTMVKKCLHKDGFLGYVQGTGKQPKDSQPVGYDVEPDFDDFGLGCFLLAGAEIYRLASH